MNIEKYIFEMNTQKYLRNGGTIEDLKKDLSIKVTYHPHEPLVILNYDQIESPKLNPIVMECRGLVLELDTWNIVARGFNRFFNLEECIDHHKDFDWNNEITITEKCDGSLILIYCYNNSWRVNTRGSFAEFNIHECGKTWAELVWQTIDYSSLLSQYSYVFEYCGPYNKIVRAYKEPISYLLTMFHTKNNYEVPYKWMKLYAEMNNINIVKCYDFCTIDDVINHINEQESNDATYEGVVLRDKNNKRIKVKSKTYVALHHLKGNNNLFLVKNLLPFILAGETEEVITYFPECKEKVDELHDILDGELLILNNVWFNSTNIESQKEFALKIKDTPFSSILFKLRKIYGTYIPWQEVEKEFRNSSTLILKVLFND